MIWYCQKISVICKTEKKCMLKWQRYTFSENGSKMSIMIPFNDFKWKNSIFLVQTKMIKEILPKLAIFSHFWSFLALQAYLFQLFWAEFCQAQVTTCYLSCLEEWRHFWNFQVPKIPKNCYFEGTEDGKRSVCPP